MFRKLSKKVQFSSLFYGFKFLFGFDFVQIYLFSFQFYSISFFFKLNFFSNIKSVQIFEISLD
jgi:hypothetical protein